MAGRPTRNRVRNRLVTALCAVGLVVLPTSPAVAATPALTWAAPVVADNYQGQPSLVSCVTTHFCMAGGEGSAVELSGTTWAAPSNVFGAYSISSLSCVSTTFCVAVGGDWEYAIFNGSTWTRHELDYDGYYPVVSCSSRHFCVAADTNGVMTFNGKKWTSPMQLTAPAARPTPMSRRCRACPRSSGSRPTVPVTATCSPARGRPAPGSTGRAR